ncbi:partial Replicative DNA helicase, partial [Gammaproteobacteria bacterium]
DVESVESYARLVREASLRRQLILQSRRAARAAVEAPDAQAVLEVAQQELVDIAKGSLRGGFVRLSDIAEKNEEEIQKIQARGSMLTGLPTGFSKLNALTQGMQRTDLIVLAARPGMGKTAFALNIASYLTIHSGYCVAFFSLEMSAPQLGFRIQCAEARVNLQRLREGRLSKEEKKYLFYTTQQMRDARFFIDDQPSISLLEMRARALQLKQAQKGLDAIFVDYLQIMGSRQKYENRTQEVGAYSRGLKALAKELDVPVIALSQLSRRTEQRGAEKEPQLSDLRESGAIEQDADLVIFLSRPEYYDKDTPDKNVCEVIVAKQRNGPTGRFSLGWSGETTRFSDLAQVPEGAGP